MDPLDRLMELARYGSPRDHSRVWRTIALVIQAREAVLRAHCMGWHAQERLARARAASQKRREDGAGHLAGLRIMKQDVFR